MITLASLHHVVVFTVKSTGSVSLLQRQRNRRRVHEGVLPLLFVLPSGTDVSSIVLDIVMFLVSVAVYRISRMDVSYSIYSYVYNGVDYYVIWLMVLRDLYKYIEKSGLIKMELICMIEAFHAGFFLINTYIYIYIYIVKYINTYM